MRTQKLLGMKEVSKVPELEAERQNNRQSSLNAKRHFRSKLGRTQRRASVFTCTTIKYLETIATKSFRITTCQGKKVNGQFLSKTSTFYQNMLEYDSSIAEGLLSEVDSLL
jgi:hypothetical protein